MIGAAAAGVGVGKKIYGKFSAAGQTAAYEAKMDPVWAAAAQKAVDAHRKVGSPPEVWNGAVASAPEGFAAYLPGNIWDPSPVTAAAGNTISGCSVQGPRPAGMTEQEWLTRDTSAYPTPAAPTSAAAAAGSGVATAGVGGSSTLLILAALALVLFTRIGKK